MGVDVFAKILDFNKVFVEHDTSSSGTARWFQDPDVPLTIHVKLWIYLPQLIADLETRTEFWISVTDRSVSLLVLPQLLLLFFILLTIVFVIIFFIVVFLLFFLFFLLSSLLLLLLLAFSDTRIVCLLFLLLFLVLLPLFLCCLGFLFAEPVCVFLLCERLLVHLVSSEDLPIGIAH